MAVPGIKLISTFASMVIEPGLSFSFVVRVYQRSGDGEPFVCRLYRDGQADPRSDYFTDDHADAIRVAADMLMRAEAQARTAALVAQRAARFPKRQRSRQSTARTR